MSLIADQVRASIFRVLYVYDDPERHSAAMNMAIDESLLAQAEVPSLRLYRWDHPALSFGYFGRHADVSPYATERDLVRRWTGGGIVLHGKDLTYSIAIPATDASFANSPRAVYAAVHDAICKALKANGSEAELASEEFPKISEACFANPVRADVLVNGQKVAGAAQRKTRAGLLQQGSIQNVDLPEDFGLHFASELTGEPIAKQLDDSVLNRATEIAAQRYSRPEWLHKR